MNLKYLGAGLVAGAIGVATGVWFFLQPESATEGGTDAQGYQIALCMNEQDYGPLTDEDAQMCYGLFTGDVTVSKHGNSVQIGDYTERWSLQSMKNLYDSLSGRMDKPEGFPGPGAFEQWWQDLPED
jgi:hypothetical protein